MDCLSDQGLDLSKSVLSGQQAAGCYPMMSDMAEGLGWAEIIHAVIAC